MQQEGNDEAFKRFVEKMNTPPPRINDEESSTSSSDHVNLPNIKGLGPIEQLQEKNLLNGRDHKSLKFREPSDIQNRNQKKTKKKGRKKGKKGKEDDDDEDDDDKPLVPPPIGPVSVLARRENQNEYILQPTGRKRKGDFPPLQEEMTDRSLANTDHKIDAFPIEDMMIHNFMPFYTYNVSDILCAASNELYRESMIINNKNATALKEKMKQEEATNGPNPAKKRKTKHNEPLENQDASPSTKSTQFSWDLPNYGSNSMMGKAELFEKVNTFYSDCMERMNRFFINDQLDPSYMDQQTPHQHRPPRTFGIYNELEQQFKVRFEERLSGLRDTASRVPKFDDEPPVTKEWINSYRLRPSSTDELCSRGTECLFNTFGKKDSMRYIGRVFESPREARERTSGSNEAYVRNKQRYCIDCLLDCWTAGTYEAVASECATHVQRNYFTVLCEPGQYNENCMIPTMMNNKPTGIIGFVPIYNQNKRISVPIKIQQIEGNHFYHISTNYLAETGMDFQ